MSGESKFGYEYRGSHARKCEAETNDESASDKHANILSSGLNDRPDYNHCTVSSTSQQIICVHSRTLPKNKAHRLPNLSFAYGANGRPAIPPIDWIALKTPSNEPVG